MLTSDARAIKDRFAVELMLFDPGPRYNIAPTQQISTIIFDGKRTLDGFRWGLVPRWAKDVSVGSKLINARAETLTERPAFRPALQRRRCLIPADGFYEWLKKSDNPGPRRFELPEKGTFAFAGLWESWFDPSGENLRSCTIITTAANDSVRGVHDRMPAILRPADESYWLDPDSNVADLSELLLPNPSLVLTATPVTTRLNYAGYDGPELLESA